MIWDAKNAGLYISYDDKGNTKIGSYFLRRENYDNWQMTSGALLLGGPMPADPLVLPKLVQSPYTKSRPDYPAELAVMSSKSKKITKITALNKALI